MGEKKDELTEQELERAAGGVRRDLAADPRMRARAAGELGGAYPGTQDKPDPEDVRADQTK